MAHSYDWYWCWPWVGCLSSSPCGALHRMAHNMGASFFWASDPIEQGRATMHLMTQPQKPYSVTSVILYWSLKSPWFSVGGDCKGCEYQPESIVGGHLRGWLPQILKSKEHFVEVKSGSLSCSKTGQIWPIALNTRRIFACGGDRNWERAQGGCWGADNVYYLTRVRVTWTCLLCEISLNTMCVRFCMYMMLQ